MSAASLGRVVRDVRFARLARLVAAAPLAAALVFARPARAAGPENRSCIASAEHGQLARYQGKLRASREDLVRCARPECPDPIHADCIRWLAEVDASLPSIVLAASWGSGGDVLGVQVTIDGEAIPGGADGRAVSIDPGAHVIAFAAAGALPPSQSVKVVIREGEKNRALRVSFARPGGDARGAAAGAQPEHVVERPIPLSAWILGGAGIAAVADAAGWYIAGRTGLDGLRSSCVDACSTAAVDDERRKLLVGDISLAAGLVSLGAASWIFFQRPTRAATAFVPRFDVAASPGGGRASLVVDF